MPTVLTLLLVYGKKKLALTSQLSSWRSEISGRHCSWSQFISYTSKEQIIIWRSFTERSCWSQCDHSANLRIRIRVRIIFPIRNRPTWYIIYILKYRIPGKKHWKKKVYILTISINKIVTMVVCYDNINNVGGYLLFLFNAKFSVFYK